MNAFSLGRVPIVAMALVLASCTSSGTFDWPEQYGGQIDSAFNYGAGGRDFSNVVVGDPFGFERWRPNGGRDFSTVVVGTVH